MSERKVRIGQVGITNHGVTILNAILDARNLALVSVTDVKAEEAERVAKKSRARYVSTYEEMLGDPETEAVALVTPNHLHADQIAMAITAKKHVFVEKPIAGKVREARRIIEGMRRAGLVLMVGHNTRKRGMFRRAKNILDERKVGSIVAVEMNISRPGGLMADMPAWKADPAAGLIPMTQLGIHFVDTIHYLLGTNTERVACIGANRAMPNGVLDTAGAILQLSTGVPVMLSSSYVTPDVYFVKIYGTDGVLSCTNACVELEQMERGVLKTVLREDFSKEGMASYHSEMTEFGECIIRGKRPETGGEEGLRALAVIEAMMLSNRTQTTVDIKDILEGPQ